MVNRRFVPLITWSLVRLAAIFLLFGTVYAPVRIELQVALTWSEWLASGSIPPGDAWQHPPGLALLLAGLGGLGIGIRGLVAIILVADASIFFMLRDVKARIFWALAPILMGPLMLARLDVVVAAVAIAGLIATSPALSGSLLGLGSALKIWPGALLIARPGMPRSRFLAACATYLMAWLCAWVWTGREASSAGTYPRGLQVESVAAWPFLVAKNLGAPVLITFRNGAHEIELALADGVAAALPWLTLAGVALLAVRWNRSPEPSRPWDRSIFVLGWLLITSRVLSPQYNIWVIGLVAVAMAHGRASRGLVASTTVTALAAHALFPFAYGSLVQGGSVGLVIQTIRLAGLATLVWIAWRRGEGAALGDSSSSGGSSAEPSVAGQPRAVTGVRGTNT